MTYKLKRTQVIDKPREEVFAFFKQPENLEKITPSQVGFQILTPKPIKMQSGAVLDYTIQLLWFKLRWTTLITNYQEPELFSDVALKSPYSFWYHTHTFIEKDNSTIMHDEVLYMLPFGILGKIVHKLFVKKQLKQIFDHRAEVIAEIFQQPTKITTTV